MEKNLKDNIWIEGFNSNAKRYDFLLSIGGRKNVIWDGRISKIPEEIAKKCVIEFGLCKGEILDDGTVLDEDVSFGFKNYEKGFGELDFKTAKESIQSACDNEYCIIYIKNT